MFLPTAIAAKIGAIVFLFILMWYGYLRTPAVFFSIYGLSASAAVEALTAKVIHLIHLSKWQRKLMLFTAFFCGTSAIVTLYHWLLPPTH